MTQKQADMRERSGCLSPEEAPKTLGTWSISKSRVLEGSCPDAAGTLTVDSEGKNSRDTDCAHTPEPRGKISHVRNASRLQDV